MVGVAREFFPSTREKSDKGSGVVISRRAMTPAPCPLTLPIPARHSLGHFHHRPRPCGGKLPPLLSKVINDLLNDFP